MKIQGGINFRDLGGLPTQDGRRLKHRRFFRSGSLSRLTPEDCQTLQAMGITHILDYRDQHEADGDRDIVWTGAHYECCPANPPTHVTTADPKDFFSDHHLSSMPMDFMQSLYKKLPFQNTAYQRLLHKAENLHEGGLLHHCAVGKDRTGVGSAIFLMALNVSQKTIIEDYLRTEEGLQPFRAKLLTKVEPLLSAHALEKLHHMMSASESFLHAAFDEIINRYGSFESYLEAEFSFTAERRTKLQALFLE
ncbi:tyrosine-protein phosphatase [Bdellovibrio sp. HCB337]|uniref:tyrosine-protein phosphatase n=1 Tax=Bdellovibrio sp. HCB337 TaxID=3394358 RepID=UPI0039A51695